MSNRLKDEASLYLRQHSDDPVDWYPWCDEAFVAAKSRDVPILLSIGYSSCHWCHVMAHESFQDAETAAVLNKYFVSIKVDREERPDVDDAYMTAVQLATGHGGWPITVFMTPDKEPFYAGTYFPKERRGDFPGFRHLAASLGQSWEGQRIEIEKAAMEFAEALRSYLSQSVPPVSPTLEIGLIDRAVETLHQEFDFENGGFGERPKFPPHATLRFLLDYAMRRHLLPGDSEVVSSLTEQAGHMALMTLEEMALGGIHDHVGGGFHRYATDAEWRLPHFEKMLSDNALLVSLYTGAAQVTGDARLAALFTRTATRAMDWIERTLGTPEGAYRSAVDADSADGEGTYYTWTLDEVVGSVGESVAQAFGVEKGGNFLEEATQLLTGRNVLYLDQDAEGAFDEALLTLGKIREGREHPAVDDKSVVALNGMVLSALVSLGRIERAEACAANWCRHVAQDGSLPHLADRGIGFLDDYAQMANGLIDVFEASGRETWRENAERIVDRMIGEFQRGGLFYAAGERHEALFGRPVPAFDGAVPSPVAEAVRSIYRLGRHDEARAALMSCLGWMQRTPRAVHSLIHLALVDFIDHPGANRSIGTSSGTKGQVRLEPDVLTLDSEGWAVGEVVISVPDGMHINSNDPTAKWLTATTIRAEGVFAEASFPDPVGEWYTGEVRVPIRVRPKSEAAGFRIIVRYQLCSGSECHLPDEVVLEGSLDRPVA